MKKYFAQPELQVVRMQNSNIITESLDVVSEDSGKFIEGDAPGRRLYDWDAGY